jgi:hypothetical protein
MRDYGMQVHRLSSLRPAATFVTTEIQRRDYVSAVDAFEFTGPAHPGNCVGIRSHTLSVDMLVRHRSKPKTVWKQTLPNKESRHCSNVRCVS